MIRPLIVLACLLAVVSAADERKAADLAPLTRWLNGQKGLRSISAEFTQTRALKALRDPQSTPGRMWFSAPDSFRWEIGQPAKSILLRKGSDMWLISPKKKKALRIPAAGTQSAMQSMAMLKFPMANNLEEFQREFKILDLREQSDDFTMVLLPRNMEAQQHLESLELNFEIASGNLRYFKIKTRDGSTLRNDFQQVETNQPIPANVFNYDLSGYTISDASE